MIHFLPLVVEMKDMVISIWEIVDGGYPRQPTTFYPKHHGLFFVSSTATTKVDLDVQSICQIATPSGHPGDGEQLQYMQNQMQTWSF